MKTIYFLLCFAFFAVVAHAQPTQPAAPPACNSNNCTAATSETCASGSTVVTNFTGATLRSGTANSVGAVYSFYNVTTVSGKQINALISIDATSNVSMNPSNFNIDDDGATDQAGTSIASFFAPRITPSANLTTSDLRGYVQFTIKFFVENATAGEQYPGDYTTIPPGGLTGLNYIHYDIDGSTVGTGGWFRETGVVQNVPGSVINANIPTELVSYSYTDGSNWKGFAGSVCERTGVSRCAQVAVAAQYATPQTQITVRMGYDYHYNGTRFNSQPTRQYGSRFGCFSFPQQGSLPVMLKSFTAARDQQLTSSVGLKWISSTEINNEGFEIQANQGDNDWKTVAFVNSKALNGNSSTDIDYSYTDFNNAKSMTQYRLRQVDRDGKFKYSEVRSVRGLEQKGNTTIVYPNPSSDGRVNVVFDNSKSTRNISLMDMSGRMIKQWKDYTNNNVQIENLGSGMYSLRVIVLETGEQSVQKIIVNNR